MIKVGDLVRWYSVKNDVQEEFDVDLGVVLRLSRSGATEHHAEVMFWDGEISWIDGKLLEKVVTEGGKKS
jgi:hypothetical protein